ncbi:MAG: HEAT repeat domain-containing protein [Candidatus Hodarchaeota archaeon]
MKNLKFLNRTLCIIFCVLLLFLSHCFSKKGIEERVDELLKEKDYTSALALLNKNIKLEPENPNLIALKVKVLVEKNDGIKAAEEYLKFYSLNKKHAPELLYEIAFSIEKAWTPLHVANESVEFGFAEMLADVGDTNRAINIWKKYLNSEDRGLQAAIALGKNGDNSGTDILKKALKSNEKKVRWDAALALAGIGDNSGIDELKEGLYTFHTGRDWIEASYKSNEKEIALAKFGDKNALDSLRNYKDLYFPDSVDNFSIGYGRNIDMTVALERLGDESIIPTLKKVLNYYPIEASDDIELARKIDKSRIDIAIALARLGDTSRIDIVIKELEDEDWRSFDKEALWTLARIGYKNAIPTLTELFKQAFIRFKHMKAYGEEHEQQYFVPLILTLYMLTKENH